MIELRWLEQETDKILQYRVQQQVTDYSAFPEVGGDFPKRKEWSKWMDVPMVTLK